MCLLKAVNIMRTRCAHQANTAVLDILRKKALTISGASLSLEEWISVLSEQYPTFKFLSLVLKYQRGILLFIRANRERKISLMVSALKKSVLLFFAFDHYNYARWISLFIQDLETLPKRIKAEFEMGHFAINRSCHRSSSLRIDYAHEQINKKIKRVLGSPWSHGKSSKVREIDGSWPRTMQSS